MEESKVIEQVVEQTEKKRRGRPSKYSKKPDFSEPEKSVYSRYVDNYKDIIESFINSETHMSKTLWNKLYEHCKEVLASLNKEFYTTYSYKTVCMCKSIDLVRENQRKEFVKEFYENTDMKDQFRGYLIFNHIKLYVIESTKEMKV